MMKLPNVKFGVMGIHDPEDCTEMMRAPDLKAAWDFLHKLRRDTDDVALRNALTALLDDHLMLEREVMRLAGIVRNENKIRLEQSRDLFTRHRINNVKPLTKPKRPVPRMR